MIAHILGARGAIIWMAYGRDIVSATEMSLDVSRWYANKSFPFFRFEIWGRWLPDIIRQIIQWPHTFRNVCSTASPPRAYPCRPCEGVGMHVPESISL